MNTTCKPDEFGFYGAFGGAFIPEILYKPLQDLSQCFEEAMRDETFVNEWKRLLKHYVGRPTPLYFSEMLSREFNAKIYLKREDLCHTGAHKINNTIGQVLLAKRMGKTRVIAETGAGQHGVATATACALLGLSCMVFMGAEDVKRQASNVSKMRLLGAEIVAVLEGSQTLKDATNAALRQWMQNPIDYFYVLGSAVGPHPYPHLVSTFQSIISEEIQEQLLKCEGKSNPNAVIACVGGGSNAAGTFFHFIPENNVRLIAAEAAGKGVDTSENAATFQNGKPGVFHGSLSLLLQNTDGQVQEAWSVSAGLDYPGIGPLHAHLLTTKRAEAIAITDDEALQAGLHLYRNTGILPAIESAHALAVLPKISFHPNDVVLVNLSGRGDKDLETYLKYI